MQIAFGVFLLGYFCVLLGCFFAYAAKSRLQGSVWDFYLLKCKIIFGIHYKSKQFIHNS